MRASPQWPDASYLRQTQRLLEANAEAAGTLGAPAPSVPGIGAEAPIPPRLDVQMGLSEGWNPSPVGELVPGGVFSPLSPALLKPPWLPAPLSLPGGERPALPQSWAVVEGGGRAAVTEALSLSQPAQASPHLGDPLQSPSAAERGSGAEGFPGPLTVELSAPEPQGSPADPETPTALHHTSLLEALEEEVAVAGRRYPGVLTDR